jgi:hypothetical protein
MEQSQLDNLDPEKAKSALINFITQFIYPAFGSLSKKEIELLVFDLMHKTELIKPKEPLYNLMTSLRITKAKAQQLVFDINVRRYDHKALNMDFKNALKNSRFTKNGDYFLIEIEEPLLRVYFKEQIKNIGYISDTSFNSDIIRIPLDGLLELISINFIEEHEKTTIKNALIEAGATDSSFTGVLKSAFKKLSERVVGDAAEGITHNLGDYFSSIFSPNKIGETWKDIFNSVNKDS